MRAPRAVLAPGVAGALLLGTLAAGAVARSGAPAAAPVAPGAPVPAALGDKMADTPDFKQIDPAAALPGGGYAHCGPVAVSNSLIWLARHGFAQLAPHAGAGKADQIALIRELSDAGHMDTSPQTGTSEADLLRGVARYVSGRGYPLARLEYRGWTAVSPPDAAPVPVLVRQGAVDPAWLRDGLRGAGAVWLQIGWYRHDRRRDRYERFDAHWATLVGVEQERVAGQPAPVLLVHDPSPRSGARPHTARVRLAALTSGMLVGRKPGLPVAAAGWYALGGELSKKPGADCGVLDGAVVLRLAER